MQIIADHSVDKLGFQTGGGGGIALSKMIIDSSGNVGIGTTSPSSQLTVYRTTSSTTNGALQLDGNGNYAGVRFAVSGTNQASISSDLSALYITHENTIHFRTGSDANVGGTERMRIDSSGNLLLGVTSTSIPGVGNTTLGASLRNANGGSIAVSREADIAGYFNRNVNDGSIIQLRKDGTVVGSIGAGDGDLIIGKTDSGTECYLRFGYSAVGIVPANLDGSVNDNALDLGSTASRVKDIYLGGGLYVGGTGSANKLDDYEEGTWTPTAVGTTSGDYTVGGGAATGAYTKIGRMVTVSGEIHLTSKNSPVGSFAIGNLPFSCANLTELAERSVGSVTTKYIDYDADCVNLATYIYAGETKFYLVQVRDNNNTLFTDCTAVESGDEIIFTLTYPTTA